jgi:hypothetical protein
VQTEKREGCRMVERGMGSAFKMSGFRVKSQFVFGKSGQVTWFRVSALLSTVSGPRLIRADGLGNGSVSLHGKKTLSAFNKCGRIAGMDRRTKKNKKPSPPLIKADGIHHSAFFKSGFVTFVIFTETVLLSVF